MENVPLTDEQRENLVAYLDGELEDSGVQVIEQSLAASPALRQEVAALTQSWDMLAVLPRVTASAEFTERTMDSVHTESLANSVPTAAAPPITQNHWLNRRTLALATGLFGLLLALLIGFRSGEQWQPPRTKVLIDNLPAVENLELYRELGNTDFLRRLHENEVLSNGSEESAP